MKMERGVVMKSFFQTVYPFFCIFSSAWLIEGCGSATESSEDFPGDIHASSAAISVANADKLITDGRAQIGASGGQCKEWVRSNTKASYGSTIPSTAANQFEWLSSNLVANVAQWRGTYVNGRLGPVNGLAVGASTPPIAVTIPNTDPQIIVLYASIGNVTATLTKGQMMLGVVTPVSGSMGGAISTPLVFGSGSATLMVKNNGGSSASNIVAVVLSRSRFVSDWETARRGDIMQMRLGPYSANRDTDTPHTTFVQTDYNSTSGVCKVADTTGCNWLDSNWVAASTVGAHNISLESMIKAVVFRSDYGFTVYRLN